MVTSFQYHTDGWILAKAINIGKTKEVLAMIYTAVFIIL